MKTSKTMIELSSIIGNVYHEKMYAPLSEGYMDRSLDRSGGKPIYDLVVVKSETHPDKYELLSGGTRYDYMVRNGIDQCDVILLQLGAEDCIEDIVVDLNKQRIKTGDELYNEFKHFSKKYPPIKGGKVNRNIEIGLELNLSPERVKKLVMLEKEFGETEYEFLITWVFDKKLSLEGAHQYRKLLKNSSNKYDVDTIKKLIENHCDFGRLSKLDSVIDLNNSSEFEIFNSFLQKTMSEEEYEKAIKSHRKTKGIVDKFNEDRIMVPEVDEKYISENTIILKGNSGDVDLSSIYQLKGKVRCLIGSCEYGYDTKRKGRVDEPEHEKLKDMSSQEFASHLSKIYERYISYLTEDGSVYVIINDYKIKKRYSLFVEHFVIEMEKVGLFLIERFMWEKTNPLPHGENVKGSTEGFEYCYRFSNNPDITFTNNVKVYDGEEISYKYQKGCSNHSNKDTGLVGEKYIQSSLSNIRNTFNEGRCMNIIKGNVGNPGDFFRQLEKKEDRHSSTSPVYLTGVFTIEGSEKGDYVMDIWNGVGNTMMSSLLLGRKYVGIEIEDNYFKQSIKKTIMTEKFIKNNKIVHKNESSSVAA